MQSRTYFEFGSIEERYKYRNAVMAAYPCGNYPVFEGYNHMQFQICDPEGFAEMLRFVMEENRLPELSFLRERSGTMDRYLRETPMLDFSAPVIQNLIERRGWHPLDEFERIQAIYNYVRDEILFGYNTDDSIPASTVLADGYGQCNTKGTLFMALLRGCGIPCRIHGFTIDKKLQKGAMTGLVYALAPKNVFHSWVEVWLDGVWYELEAFILDKAYLNSLQAANPDCTGAFCGYGVAVRDFRHPVIDFDRNNTYIQSEGINQDFGVYDSPDELLREHHQEMPRLKAFAYRNFGRHLMNGNVKKIRMRK